MIPRRRTAVISLPKNAPARGIAANYQMLGHDDKLFSRIQMGWSNVGWAKAHSRQVKVHYFNHNPLKNLIKL